MTLTPIYKLLSDETRLRVILLLSKDQLCVCELCGILEEPQPKISKILSKLRDLNLVTDERKEKFVFYTICKNNALLDSNIDFINNHLDDYPKLKEDNRRLAEKEKHIDACSLKALKDLTE